jgi:hypothetical protein
MALLTRDRYRLMQDLSEFRPAVTRLPISQTALKAENWTDAAFCPASSRFTAWFSLSRDEIGLARNAA